MKPIPVTTSSVRMWLLAHTQAHVQRDLASGRILADFVVLGQPKNYLVVGDRVADHNGSWSATGVVAQPSLIVAADPPAAFSIRQGAAAYFGSRWEELRVGQGYLGLPVGA